MDFRGIANDAMMLHAVGERLANSREWPNWSPDSEFRAVRDRSADERSAGPAPARVSGAERCLSRCSNRRSSALF